MVTISDEARTLHEALAASPIAFSYFDGGDRLRIWNAAYERLNFRIRDLVRQGAFFPDLLAEVVVRGQVDIPPGQVAEWVARRLQLRRHGTTTFRTLADDRTYLVQERRDEIGGTLGFWVDVSDLVRQKALVPVDTVETAPHLADHGCQDQIRTLLQAVLGNLDFLAMGPVGGVDADLIADARRNVQAIAALMDACRGMRPVRDISPECVHETGTRAAG